MGTSISPDQIQRYELTEVYSHPEAVVDIVLVHGLNGHPQKTWTAKNGVFWPTQLLPVSLRGAKARVLVYGYNADVYTFGSSTGNANSEMIHQHARTLVSHLALWRQSEDATENPIIWVAHSLGGILVKRALEYSNDLSALTADPDRSIYVATYGIIFLGTPHTGSDKAKMGTILQAIVGAVIPKGFFHTEPQLVRTLLANNEVLQNINVHFLDIFQRFKIDFVYEGAPTEFVKGMKDFVVDRASACPELPGARYYGIEADHSHMCKFESKGSPGYLNVSTEIRGWVTEAPPVIRSRFAVEHKARQQVVENAAKEMLGIPVEELRRGQPQASEGGSSQMTPVLSNSGILPITSIEPEASETHFIKPHGFRPNSIFVGRADELAEMHKLLFDEKRRNEGTATVLLQCMPGGGKTHLARQYLYNHIDEFPGGIFWIRAISHEQLAAGYWEIARKVALKAFANTETKPKDPAKFVSIVNDWFCSNHQWLLVLDGIHFDHSEELQRYIPDSKNGSLIYTSTEASVARDRHFMNPQVIRIPLLSAREAQSLFLLELDKKHPTQEDKLHSLELVQRMGFLPLVINCVAQRLKRTGEPLAKFARRYAAGPKLRNLDTYKAVVEDLVEEGAVEALNLMKIMCIFSQHIPYEMISFGLKAVAEVPLKANEPMSGRSLNNTFSVLNRFALVNRSEHNESLHSSRSSKTSRDSFTRDVDVIRVHSVVQDFFIDSLRGDGSLSVWLIRVAKMFAESYDQANMRIQRKASSGLVGDYRIYEVHCTRILQHVTRHEKKSGTTLRSAREILERCLNEIKSEIDKRTQSSSQEILEGRHEEMMNSVFDRSSTSSDTGPETPGRHDQISNRSTTWGTDDKVQHESPTSMQHPDDSFPFDDKVMQPPSPPLVDSYEGGFEGGYEADGDDTRTVTTITAQNLRELPQDRESDNPWNLVQYHKPTFRPSRQTPHRTIKSMEENRYRDRAGSWRSMGFSRSDPRVNPETIPGVMNSPWVGDLPRGRPSAQSQAAQSLGFINQSSPSPVRGGGPIKDTRRSSQRPSRLSERRSSIMMGHPTYSSPVSANVFYDEPVTTPIEIRPNRVRASSKPSPRPRPATPAMQSLQNIPQMSNYPEVEMPAYPAPQERPSNSVHRHPYPSSESLAYNTFAYPSQENMLDYSRPRQYARQTGPLPVEYADGEAETKAETPAAGAVKHGYPHDSLGWQSQGSTDFPPIEVDISNLNDAILFRHINPTPKAQARSNPFDDDLLYPQQGYTSQPMTRDNSSRSGSGTITLAAGQRRPSVARSEPDPTLPHFSPRISPTSYQVYEKSRLRDREEDAHTEGPVRKSPKLGFSRAAAIESVGEWTGENIPPRPSSMNAMAPSFIPRDNNKSKIAPPATLTQSHSSPPFSISQDISPDTGDENAMSRSSSGGLKIGGRIIAFGDFPEPVDLVLARERAEKQRADRIVFDKGGFR